MKAVLLVLLAVVAVATADHWAVLIAGSNGYGNYRHQSDICHAYQIVHKNGIPDDHIIIFMYDDIANNAENPYKGKVFNHPTPKGTPGIDVYKGCLKDYTGSTTTAANLLNAIQGNQAKVPAGHKVLKSTSEDNVFMYYSDHGGTGLVAMPVGPYLYATDLIAALKNMWAKKMYNKLVFYLEACESGSMFSGVLPTNINVFATTASDPDESSWGWYCDEESGGSEVDGKDIGSCLGDEYSVRWMENSDLGKATETLQEQFEAVKKATTKSHVMEYGSMSFNTEKIWNYQGNKTALASTTTPGPLGRGVNSRDAQLHYLYKRYLREPTAERAAALSAEVSSREAADTLFTNLARTVYGNEFKTVMNMKPAGVCDEKCCQPVVNYLREHNVFSDYSLKYVRSIVNMCEQGSDAEYLLTAAKDLVA